jgi:membrane fusion protein, multidrug efflux system
MTTLGEALVGGLLGVGAIVLISSRTPADSGMVDLPGIVEALNAADVRAKVAGDVIAMPFAEGKPVKAGDVLALLDVRHYQDAVDRAEATLASDQATLNRLRLALDRAQPLVTSGQVAKEQIVDEQSAVAQAEAAVKVDQADVERARNRLNDTKVTAPFDGIAGLREVDVGDRVQADDPHGIVVVRQVDPVSVIFGLPVDRLPEVRSALAEGPLPLEAWDRRYQKLLGVGSLDAIDNRVDEASRMVRLKGIFPNAELQLWPGNSVRVRLRLTQERDRVALLPTAAAASVQPPEF